MPHRRSTARHTRRGSVAICLAGLLLLAACGVPQGVASRGPSETERPPAVGAADETPETAPPSTAGDTAPVTTTPPATPPSTLPTISEPAVLADIPIGDVIDVGLSKPTRSYDAFVAAAYADIERWWNEVLPAVYGIEFEPLIGGTYAGYPGRVDEIPGCPDSITSYPDLNLFVAFYCQFGDFMAYDDGDDSLLTALADEFGPAVMGVVLAHEYGHAVQGRVGLLDEPIATIFTEQQADCFSGAWTGQAYRGESPLVRLGDRDVRTGLIAMLSVRDPVGTNQFQAGGHGSAFDRVGAFQEGFLEGPARCAELIDQPLTLMPNDFQPRSLDEFLGGNAPYDCAELEGTGVGQEVIDTCTPAPAFLADDLNDFWATALGDAFTPLSPSPAPSLEQSGCADPTRLASEVALCFDAGLVAYDEPAVLDLYFEFGDFTLGYFYGIAWAEASQRATGSALTGEARSLRNDCLTGAWVRDITPDAQGNTSRETSSVQSSPGDLDEAIRMAIIVGDPSANDDVVGSPFEKINAFRVGVLGGLDACNDLITD